MATKQMRVYTLEEMVDRHIGKKGTPVRDRFEYKLQMALLGNMIRQTRIERNLTQEQLGKKVGVQKAQISKLERGASSATIGTIVKVFTAMKADIQFNVRLGGRQVTLKDQK